MSSLDTVQLSGAVFFFFDYYLAAVLALATMRVFRLQFVGRRNCRSVKGKN
jgi:hypothetical protein